MESRASSTLGAGTPAPVPHPVATGQEHQLLEVLGGLQPPPRADAQRAVAQGQRLDVMLDQPGRPRRDQSGQRLQGGGDVVLRVDRLADVAQEHREEEFLVIRQFISRQSERLKTVVEDVALGRLCGFSLTFSRGTSSARRPWKRSAPHPAAGREGSSAALGTTSGKRPRSSRRSWRRSARASASTCAWISRRVGRSRRGGASSRPRRWAARVRARKNSLSSRDQRSRAASKAICRRRFSLGMGSCLAARHWPVVARRGGPQLIIPDRAARVIGQADAKKRGRSAFSGEHRASVERASHAGARLRRFTLSSSATGRCC